MLSHLHLQFIFVFLPSLPSQCPHPYFLQCFFFSWQLLLQDRHFQIYCKVIKSQTCLLLSWSLTEKKISDGRESKITHFQIVRGKELIFFILVVGDILLKNDFVPAFFTAIIPILLYMNINPYLIKLFGELVINLKNLTIINIT